MTAHKVRPTVLAAPDRVESYRLAFRKMSTRLLAKQLGLIEVIEVDKRLASKHIIQPMDFLLIVDFEATCWDKADTTKRPPEIIEFPAVLYNIMQGKVVAEFQQYVMPVEVPKLTEFCTKLTGITQRQVDCGVPLGTCLMLFTNWLKEQTQLYNLTFDLELQTSKRRCAIVTWSDWDLGTCLKHECKRKGITKPNVFNKWIDLRALYLEHYNRRPKGLNGALSEVGLIFVGQEHCGLHDARNTALLAGRMISEGVLLRITKDISPHTM